jgi:uncharacterized protein involved in exopolysaccharide biosynthesis
VIKTWRVSLEGIVFLLVGAVLCSASLFMLARPNEYRAVARIKVHREVQSASTGGTFFSDPYFIQTEFEVIQSEVVLGKVVEKLGLASEWAKKRAAGERLKPVEAIGLLKRQLDFKAVPNMELIEIRVSSDDPAEAAKLANTIAKAFQDFRLEQNRLLKTEAEKANSRLTTCQVEIVDSAIAPARAIRPNRPLVATVFLFGSLLVIFGIYSATKACNA